MIKAPHSLIEALADEIYNCGTMIDVPELIEAAYQYGEWEWIEDADGNTVDGEYVITRRTLQEVADIYTDGFDCLNW